MGALLAGERVWSALAQPLKERTRAAQPRHKGFGAYADFRRSLLCDSRKYLCRAEGGAISRDSRTDAARAPSAPRKAPDARGIRVFPNIVTREGVRLCAR
jgi:hypothetical protein